MKLANLIVSGRQRVGIAFEGGFALLPEGMPENVGQIIEGGAQMLRALEGLSPRWLEVIPAPKAKFAPITEAGKKLLMVGVNYRNHAAECNLQPPPYPVVFGKFSNAMAASGDVITPPAVCRQLDYEAELVVLIGKTCRNVSVEDAEKYIFGYTCGNDFSARDLQSRTSQWCVGKTADGFAPTGPVVVTANSLSPQCLGISCRVNGERKQEATTADMIFSPFEIVSYLSSVMTLEAGDAIFTGTPEGVILGLPAEKQAWLKAGDVVEVEIEGIGTLKNVIG